jgi:tetratricopeptide (TPR) repeat protein
MSEHELWNELGNLYFLSGSYDQAIHAYTRSIALEKGSGRSYSNMAAAYAQKGRYGEAIILYQRGIKLLTDDREKALSWYKLGNVYRALKQYQLATNAYQNADELTLDIYPGIGSENDGDVLLNRKPIIGEAIHLTDQIQEDPPAEHVSKNPRPTSAASQQTFPVLEEFTPWCFDDQVVPEDEPVAFENETWPAEITENLETEDTIVSKEPLKWEVAGSKEVATVDLELQNEINADETIPPYIEFEVSTVGMQFPETLPSVSSCGTFDPQSTSPTQQIGEIENRMTEEQLTQVVVIDPEQEIITPIPEFVAEDLTDPEAIQYKTLVESLTVELSQEERGAILANIDKFKRVLDINPRNASAWDTLGTQYKTLGQYDEAINAYQKAVSLDSSKAFYFHHLGLVYAAVERIDDAIAAFERVIKIDPKHSLAHATLGGYYRKMEMDERAQEHIEKARSLLDEDENEYNRACLEAICGNSDHALELLEVALKNKQTYVNWARKDPDLDFIRNDPRFHELLVEYATKPT